MSKRIGKGGLTRSVGHSSTEPRVGSSNLSGRAAHSENQRKSTASKALLSGLFRMRDEQFRVLRDAVLSEDERRQIARLTRAVAAGRLSPAAGRRAVVQAVAS